MLLSTGPTPTAASLKKLRDALLAASSASTALQHRICVESPGCDSVSVTIERIGESRAHALRSVVGKASAFLVASFGYDGDKDEQECVRNVDAIQVGSSVGLNPVTLLHSNIHSVIPTMEIRGFHGHAAQLVPLPKSLARRFLSLCGQVADVPPTTRFAKQILPIFAYSRNEHTSKLGYLGMALPRPQCDAMPCLFNVDDCGIMSKKTGMPFSASSVIQDFVDAYSWARHGLTPCMQAYAQYNVLEPLSLDTPTSAVYLEVTWNTVSKLLSPPISPNTITLTLDYVPGTKDLESHFSTATLRMELEKLRALSSVDSETLQKETWWQETFSSIGEETVKDRLSFEAPPDSSSKKSDKVSLLERVEAFLDSAKFNDLEPVTPISSKAGGVGSDASLVLMGLGSSEHSIFPSRVDLDFTDRLWVFCIHAISYNDLYATFSIIAQELQSGELQPMISKNNTTRLASLIRDCTKLARIQTSIDYNQRRESVEEALGRWLHDPLEWLVEIGVTKLRRDYCFHLISSNLTNWKQLDPFLDTKNNMDMQITCLGHLHKVLEIWSLAQTNIMGGLPHFISRSVIAAVLERLVAQANDVSDEIKVAIVMPRFQVESNKLVDSICESLEPSVWRLSLFPPKEQETLCNNSSSTGTCVSSVAHDLVHLIQFSQTNVLFQSDRLIEGADLLASEEGQYYIVRASAEC